MEKATKAASIPPKVKGPDASGTLFNGLIESRDLKNDAGLARALKVAPPVIYKHRAGMPFGAGIILKIHETFGVPVADIRAQIAPVQK